MNAVDKRNASLNIVGESLWGFQAALVASATVLTVVLREFGASAWMIGSIMSIETVGFIMPQVMGLYMFRSRKNRRQRLVFWHLATVIPMMFFMGFVILLAPRIPAYMVRWALLACFSGFVLSIGIILSVWMDWLADLFNVSIRGTVLGLSFGFSALMGSGGAIIAGWLLKTFAAPGIYAGLFIGAGVIEVISIMMFYFVSDPPANQPSAPRLTVETLISHFRESLAEPNFFRFLISRIITSAGFFIAPFIALYYMSSEGGFLAKGTIVTCGAALTGGTAVANIALGRLGDSFGHRLGILCGALMQVVTLLILLNTSGLISCVAAYACAGFCFGAGFISNYNMMFETCPHDSRVSHITIGNLITSLGTAAIPLIGGAIVARYGLQRLFTISLIISIIAVLWIWFGVKEPRKIVGLQNRL